RKQKRSQSATSSGGLDNNMITISNDLSSSGPNTEHTYQNDPSIIHNKEVQSASSNMGLPSYEEVTLDQSNQYENPKKANSTKTPVRLSELYTKVDLKSKPKHIQAIDVDDLPNANAIYQNDEMIQNCSTSQYENLAIPTKGDLTRVSLDATQANAPVLEDNSADIKQDEYSLAWEAASDDIKVTVGDNTDEGYDILKLNKNKKEEHFDDSYSKVKKY
ncbi:unnamed protein product, partial [Owenia fusiformis]